ncbi:MAG: single-stranded-DNA-specific exonuclease RecJ [Paludibacteraceae bacterium]|jgi:single-stranded-DNA-specific exonuclease|nr:single-stranded-DNA-specific exonuclease RecJ [Paludibacteraceae bacterium]MBQ6765615.1 single-stranded-DNA-specific exonuclease RecJ [Paludibacteraceae bacterium]MDY6373877.1 single-stranded-DNA-specific exonuclease RecJ [Bacteroidales bacterium]MDY6427803.1 single-stranded-DNA-specific exonuclease RecJ [Bacteroidales bacterium]
MESHWIINNLSEEDERCKESLVEELKISPTLCQLLVQRGIRTMEDARRFFHPQLNHIHDPFLLNDMDKAVERINRALGKKEKILIYGDYDVDGTTAVALVYKFLQQFYSNIDFYIPDRYDEGYGISYKGIDYASENGFSLIIVLDCGIKAVEKVKYATQRNVDIIICDHHNPDDVLPPAVAVLDPKRVDSTYPYSHLSGCGVGFKLMQALATSNGFSLDKMLFPLMDLLAVSIASDIVPITGENRVLMMYGLKQLNSNPSVGLQGIIEVCGLRGKEVTVSDIVFKIGPRINASGRMHSAGEAVELLVTKDLRFAKDRSGRIDRYNQERKDLDKKTTDEALDSIKDDHEFANRNSIVVYNPKWSKGVIGIVASRLSEKYYRPSVVLTLSNGFATGSARSISGFDIYKAIDSCRDLLENFGGHIYAAGLTLKEENVPEFQRRFDEYVTANITEDQKTPQIDVDAVIHFSEITPKFFNILHKFAPFGPENLKPVFVTHNVVDFGTSRLVGRDLEHLKLELTEPDSENVMNGIAFGMGEQFNDHIKELKPISICYTIEENNFNGNKSIQLMVKDIKV